MARKKGHRTTQVRVNVEAEKASIKSVLDNCVKAIENSDIESFSKLWAHVPDILVLGTDAGERLVGWDALKKAIQEQWAAFPHVKTTMSDVTVHLLSGGRSAWATSLTAFKATVAATGQEIEISTRDTWVLEKRNKGWVIVHVHHSVGRTA